MRVRRAYGEKSFQRAIQGYTDAIGHATGGGVVSGPVPDQRAARHGSSVHPPAPHPCPPLQTASARDIATLHYNRARARYRLGDHCAAIEDCTAALRYDGAYRNALAQRAECYMVRQG
jgi:hypothetical protein